MDLDGQIAEAENRLGELRSQKRKRQASASDSETPYCPEPLLRGLPVALLTDSYKAAHFAQYPEAKKMVAYGAFRKPYRMRDNLPHDKSDTRMVIYGMRYIIESHFKYQWTMADVDKAAHFYKTHGVGFKEFPFPRELFEKFVKENNGYLPVKVEALQEGSVVHAGCPAFQITAEAPYAHLCTFMEPLLTHLWYPTTVATLSRRARDAIEEAFERSVDGGVEHPSLPSRLHDFGFRGCTCVEQSVIGGTAHLLNFEGTDTMSAAYYAQFALNGGKPVATSIPATEHSVMTSWATEREAMLNMVQKFGTGAYAIVMDSYDYANALSAILPTIKAEKLEKGGFLVLRPDSGDPVEVVLMGLQAAEKVFGCDVNSKGYKVPRGCSVIQGDGIDITTLREILTAVQEAGYSAQSAGFGMGGGLLQKVNRDTMSFATKLCHIHYADDTRHDIMKAPKTDPGKFSLPGILQVRLEDGVPTAYSVPADGGGEPLVSVADNLLRVVYDKGPVDCHWETFSQVRERVKQQWAATPRTGENVSSQLKERVKEVSAAIHARVSGPAAV